MLVAMVSTGDGVASVSGVWVSVAVAVRGRLAEGEATAGGAVLGIGGVSKTSGDEQLARNTMANISIDVR